jgi:predicted aconitase with swiveling domain
MLFTTMTTKVALGAVVTRVPAMTDFDRDIFETIRDGDWIRVDADAGVVEVQPADQPIKTEEETT